MKKIVKKVSTGKKIAVSAGIIAVGAGVQYFFGPKSKEHQKKAKAVIAEIKKAVEQKLADVERVTKPMYHKTVDTLAKTYHKQYKAHKGDIDMFTKKLKSEWNSVQKVIHPAVKKAKPVAKKKTK
jgi:gas vesicle protein